MHSRAEHGSERKIIWDYKGKINEKSNLKNHYYFNT